MFRGRVIYQEISVSRRFNKLLTFPLGEFSQLLYLTSYPHADDWGHIPFDPEWIRLRVIPGTKRDLCDITAAIIALVEVLLWETPYEVDGDYYCHIFNFETKCRDSIRKRKHGVYPDESGEIPRCLEPKDGEKFDIDACIANAARIRSIPDNSGNGRKKTVRREGNGIEEIRREVIKITQKAPAGGIVNNFFDKDIKIKGQSISKSFLNALLKATGTKYDVGRILYRANKNAEDVKSWIMGGLKSDGYIFKSVTDEDEKPKEVNSWIESNVLMEGEYANSSK